MYRGNSHLMRSKKFQRYSWTWMIVHFKTTKSFWGKQTRKQEFSMKAKHPTINKLFLSKLLQSYHIGMMNSRKESKFMQIHTLPMINIKESSYRIQQGTSFPRMLISARPVLPRIILTKKRKNSRNSSKSNIFKFKRFRHSNPVVSL